jgi:CHAD domain-containing protein
MTISYRYALRQKDSLARWRERLREAFALDSDGSAGFEIHYYDSFDWRVHRAGSALKWEQRDGDSRLTLYSREAGGRSTSAPLPDPPQRFPAALPAGRLRRRLESLLGPRALLPVARLATRSHCLRLTDSEGKTRVRVFVSQHRLLQPGRPARTLTKEIRVEPLRGYGRAADTITNRLQSEYGLEPDGMDLLDRVLARLGKDPEINPLRLDVPLDPAQRADAAVRRILLVLLATMEANEDGLLENLDTEFLHDFRVAVRRTRSALGQLKTVFAPSPLARYTTEFAWLGALTTVSRDLDVYLLTFGDYQSSLPEAMRPDLEPLRAFLLRHQHEEHAAMHKALRSARYRRLKNSWRRYLTSPLAKRPRARDAGLPIGLVARRRTWRMYKRVLREGQAITPQSPPPELHELRKSCKKLRYLMEFFQTLYPRRRIRRLIKELKALQDNLGDFQDLDVQTHTLGRFREQMRLEGSMSVATELAMDKLLDGFAMREQSVRNDFEARFEQFASDANRRRFRALFKPEPEMNDTTP